jgi:hypothetical protein
MTRDAQMFIDRSKEYHLTAGQGSFHTHFRIWVMLIVEDPNVKRQLIEFVRQDMDVDLHERLYNITLRHKMK